MGDVLTFKPPQPGSVSGSRSRKLDAVAGGEGEIVFFPGVRIERHTVDLSLRVSPRGRGSPPHTRRKPGKRS